MEDHISFFSSFQPKPRLYQLGLNKLKTQRKHFRCCGQGLGKSMLTLCWPKGRSLTFRTGTKRERLKMRPKQPRPQQKERQIKTDLEMNTHLLSDEQVESKWCWGDRSYIIAKNPRTKQTQWFASPSKNDWDWERETSSKRNIYLMHAIHSADRSVSLVWFCFALNSLRLREVGRDGLRHLWRSPPSFLTHSFAVFLSAVPCTLVPTLPSKSGLPLLTRAPQKLKLVSAASSGLCLSAISKGLG